MKFLIFLVLLHLCANLPGAESRDWWTRFQEIIKQEDEGAFMSYLQGLSGEELLHLGEKYCIEYVKSEEQLEATYLVSPILSQYITIIQGRVDPNTFFNIIVDSRKDPFWRLSVIRWLAEKYRNSKVSNFLTIFDVQTQKRFISTFENILTNKKENKLVRVQAMCTVECILDNISQLQISSLVNKEFWKTRTKEYVQTLETLLQRTDEEELLVKAAAYLGRQAKTDSSLKEFLLKIFQNREKYPKRVQYTIAYHLAEMGELTILPELGNMLKEAEEPEKKQIQWYIQKLKNMEKEK